MKVVMDGEQSEEAEVLSGVPKGSVLGPLLFLCPEMSSRSQRSGDTPLPLLILQLALQALRLDTHTHRYRYRPKYSRL